ncbi:hypothetical protein XENOCAPTIV_023660, partial [Xenoophorus captivus]
MTQAPSGGQVVRETHQQWIPLAYHVRWCQHGYGHQCASGVTQSTEAEIPHLEQETVSWRDILEALVISLRQTGNNPLFNFVLLQSPPGSGPISAVSFSPGLQEHLC